jgi:signal transduction histidine kinase
LEREDIELSPEDGRDLAHRIARNADKLHALGVLAPNRSIGDVGALARAVVRDAELDRHSVHVNADPVIMAVDHPKVERILDNLIANAVRHTPAGTDVWVRVCEHAGGALIAVEDAGPGVPIRDRQSIFEPFERVDSNSSSPGLGIGLSLVAKFAELHEGRAWVEGRPGGGASFRVLLPAGTPD